MGHSALTPAVETTGDLSTILDASYATLNTDHFSLICSPLTAESEKIALLLELAYHHFESTFTGYDFRLRTPEERLRWVAFSTKDSFNRYAVRTEGQDLSWLTGYYSAKTNLVAIVTSEKMAKWQVKTQPALALGVIACPPDAETGLVRLVHEAAHQLSFNTGLQKRRVMYPLWASEGLAMFFERSLLSEYFHSSRYTSLRARRLASLYRRGELVRLDDFISITHPGEATRAIDVYAQAWGLFQFLFEYRADSLREYFSSLYDLEPGFRSEPTLRSEFVRAFGPPDRLERHWQRFIEELPSR
ncbi:MAG: hypothetical protein A2Z25_02015 [Planctomycetes bacterium RBG_16_55_9]|nr:MAG: hypothetical protein A2Z25_02015 [Planctomycetes bacterium RBG_16_55_9]